MELSNLSVWFFSTLGSTGLLVSIGYLFKDVIFKYYEKKIALNFEKELEHLNLKLDVKRKV